MFIFFYGLTYILETYAIAAVIALQGGKELADLNPSPKRHRKVFGIFEIHTDYFYLLIPLSIGCGFYLLGLMFLLRFESQ